VTWDSGDFHYFEDVEQDGPLTCQYVFVLDALNFCFWPTEKYCFSVEMSWTIILRRRTHWLFVAW
jgi:hypothetical protein